MAFLRITYANFYSYREMLIFLPMENGALVPQKRNNDSKKEMVGNVMKIPQ